MDILQRDLDIVDRRPFPPGEERPFDECVAEAMQWAGIRRISDAQWDRLLTPESTGSRTLARQAVHYLRDARSVRASLRRHGTDTVARYRALYEGLDSLWSRSHLDAAGSRTVGLDAWTRLDALRTVEQLADGLAQPSVLEAGCGFGGNLAMLKQMMPHAQLAGFEYTHARAASAKVNLALEAPETDIFLADVTDLRLPDASADIVFSFYVLEQLGQERAEQALREMWRVARVAVVIDEPSIRDAGPYERWRMKRLGYCRDLLPTAENLGQVVENRRPFIRAWPNTGRLIAIRTPSA